MKLSIVTTTYTLERQKDLEDLLDSIKAQSSPDFEVFVVVERSDILADNIKKYVSLKNIPNINVIFNDKTKGASASRNIAIEQVTTDLIAFVDDDAILDQNWADKVIKGFEQDNSVVGITGPILPAWESESMKWIPPEFYWIFSCTDNAETEKIEVRNGYGANLSFRTRAVKQSGLFNTELGVKGRGKAGWQEPGGEETDLCLRIRRETGMKIVYLPDVIVHHKVYKYRISHNFVTRRAYWEGYTKALLNSRFKNSKAENKTLNREFKLLRKILFHRLPRSLGMLFYKPGSAIRQLSLIFTVLSCVSWGYFKYKIKA